MVKLGGWVQLRFGRDLFCSLCWGALDELLSVEDASFLRFLAAGVSD